MEIKFDVTYTKSNVSEYETQPTLFYWLDAHFKGRNRCKLLLGKEGDVHKGLIIEYGGGKPTPISSLCFGVYSWRNGNRSANGTGHILLSEIMRDIKNDGVFERELPIKMYTYGGDVKHIITVTVTHFSVDNGKSLDCRVINKEKRTQILENYTNRVMSVAQSLPDTFMGTDRMRVPFDYSDSGFQTTENIPLPAVAFCMTETPRSNTHYWKNALEVVMRRDNLKMDDWHQLNLAGKARAAHLMLGYLIQYADYVGDSIDRNTKYRPYSAKLVEAGEHFSSTIEPATAVDCEDGGNGMLQVRNAFIEHKFDKKEVILIEAQNIIAHYVPPLSLDNVRGQQVSDNVEQFGAHMNDNFVLISKFQEWMNNSRESRKIAQAISWPQQTISEGLPTFVVGEGTGMYEPYGYESPMLPTFRYVYSNAPSLEPFKKPILHKKGEPGSFFVGSLEGYTDFFYRHNLSRVGMGFWYCTIQSDGTLTRGVSYEAMMNDANNITIKVQEKPNDAVCDIIDEAISRRIPPDPLILDKDKIFKETNHHLDRICDAINKLQRPKGSKHNYAPVYVRPHLLNDKVVQNIIRDLKKKEHVSEVSYMMEKITNDIWGFEVRIYVNNNNTLK